MRQSVALLVRTATSKIVRKDKPGTVYIGNLHWITGKVREAFEKFGPVKDVRIPIDWDRGINRGFAFVTFEQKEDRKKALAATGLRIDNKPVYVRAPDS